MNKAPSKFILSHSSGGECQWRRCLAVPGFRGDWTAINESYRSLASWPSGRGYSVVAGLELDSFGSKSTKQSLQTSPDFSYSTKSTKLDR